MARTNKPSSDPPTAELGIAHDHGDGDAHHIHRLGNVPHGHDKDGRPVFEDPTQDPTDDLIEQDRKLARGGNQQAIDRLAAIDSDPPTGFGHDEFGTDPATGDYHPAPDPAPATSHADAFNGEAERRAAAHRAAVAAAVTDQDRADMEAIRHSHPDILNGQVDPQPPAVAGPPGHSIGDVLANDMVDTGLGPDNVDPVLRLEKVYTRLAVNSLARMTAEFHRYKKPADAGLLMALRDQVEQLVANRGLNGNGGGS